MAGQAIVGIVVVNYNGGDLTLRCLTRLHDLTWPIDRTRIVLVDNGSDDGVVTTVRSRWPDVDIVEAGSNLGFAAGCNRGFRRLRDVDYVALCNNDALPEEDWLEPLVACLDGDATIGAATPKVLLARRYAVVDLATGTSRAGAADPRNLGVQVARVRVDGVDVTGEVEFGGGFWGRERDEITIGGDFRWTAGAARLLAPAPQPDVATARLTLDLACGLGPRHVTVRVGERATTADIAERPQPVSLDGVAFVDVINNTGTVVLADGSVADRGFLEADAGQYDGDDDRTVTGWSGAAVLLRRAYLDDTGPFDERLFLYYEDADLSMRGARRGWTYRYVPESVVRHEHSATTRRVSDLVRHLAARNRLVVLTKLGDRDTLARALRRLAADLAGAAWRDVAHPALRARRPNTQELASLGRVAGGYLRLAPAALAFRWRARDLRRSDAAGG